MGSGGGRWMEVHTFDSVLKFHSHPGQNVYLLPLILFCCLVQPRLKYCYFYCLFSFSLPATIYNQYIEDNKK